MAAANDPNRYVPPGFVTTRIFNRLVVLLTKMGVSIRGSRELRVKGRTSGEWRSTPVNPLDYDGHRYLVSPRGHTQWVKNLRAAGTGELHVGRRVEQFRAVEVADSDKTAILREYLRRWSMETGVFFGGVKATAPDAELERIAPDHPVFEITEA